MIEIEKMDSDFDNKLRGLNSAQLGSFGELVFISTFKKMKVSIERYHDDKFDYLINGDPVDVKTTIRNITKEHSKVSHYTGPKVQGVQYALVEFFKTGARITLEGEQVNLLNLQELNDLWLKWIGGYGKMLPINKNDAKEQALKSIKNEITSFFSSNGLEARIIYRTCEKGFGKESPDNLKPKNKKVNRITVYLSFNDNNISRYNFYKIIAFPDTDIDGLPMLEKVRLNKPKVDLDQLPEKYIFQNIEDLKEHYFG